MRFVCPSFTLSHPVFFFSSFLFVPHEKSPVFLTLNKLYPFGAKASMLDKRNGMKGYEKMRAEGKEMRNNMCREKMKAV